MMVGGGSKLRFMEDINIIDIVEFPQYFLFSAGVFVDRIYSLLCRDFQTTKIVPIRPTTNMTNHNT